jgi:hypothetical protein
MTQAAVFIRQEDKPHILVTPYLLRLAMGEPAGDVGALLLSPTCDWRLSRCMCECIMESRSDNPQHPTRYRTAFAFRNTDLGNAFL